MAKKKEKTENAKTVKNLCTFLSPVVSNEGAVRMPAIKLAYLPFGLLIDNFMLFIKLGALFALLISLVSWIFGFVYICSLSIPVNFPCAGNGNFLPVYIILKYFLLFLFAVKWYQLVLNKESLSWRNIFSLSRSGLAAMGVLALFFVLNLTPMLSFYLLWIRVPNPDAVVEVAYFGLVSIGFLVPFVLLRFYSLFGLVVDGCQLPSWREIWRRSRGNTLKILLALFLIFLLALFVFFNFYLNMRGYDYTHAYWTGVSSEYVYDLLLLLLLSLFINHCYIQKLFLFGEPSNERTN